MSKTTTDGAQPTVGNRPSPADAAGSGEPPEVLFQRVIVEHIRPAIDGGQFPIKRTVGEPVRVTADIFADGHDVVAAVLRDRPAGESGKWRETPMTLVAPGTDEWAASFEVDAPGWYQYEIAAWVDRFQTWRRDLTIKNAAGQDVALELLEGSRLLAEAAARTRPVEARRPDAARLLALADALTGSTPVADRVEVALSGEAAALMDVYADRSRATTSETLRVWVDRERARFGAWYELFPRSAGPDPARSGTFREAAAMLPRIADLDFDVVYLPPVHPIGVTFRKGRRNALVAAPDDPGSPWAIGSPAGGHTAVDPGLGTLEDFDAFRVEAERLGLEVALDLAWQASPDHPWVREHPGWFRHRPDGTIRYAENPPKKYQDIYPFDFECDDWRALWKALLGVTLFWIERGVRIFRVDNPHTKTLRFWGWMIDRVRRRHPDVIFLAEAFTRPKVMRYLAKAGFTQSYTYFTWRNTKADLTEYFTELTTTDMREYFRPNLFANTPDILSGYLQTGGRPAFETRLLLAATLGASYGIYSGFELCERRPAAPGSEEYANSEKYEYRKRNWDRGGRIEELIARVNRARRSHRALQFDDSLQFHATDNPEIIAYSKSSPDRSEVLLTVVNLDPHHMQHGSVQVPLAAIGVGGDQFFTAHDLLDDTTYTWRGERNYVRFDPDIRQGHILWLQRFRT
jgi:starch synthase (maltosyl-transferring)